MLGFDGTGPEGKGALTGRQRGRCNSENETGIKGIPRGQRREKRLKMKLGNQSHSPGNREGNRRKGRW